MAAACEALFTSGDGTVTQPGYATAATKLTDLYIYHLRQALGIDPANPWSVLTVHGTGSVCLVPAAQDAS